MYAKAHNASATVLASESLVISTRTGTVTATRSNGGGGLPRQQFLIAHAPQRRRFGWSSPVDRANTCTSTLNAAPGSIAVLSVMFPNVCFSTKSMPSIPAKPTDCEDAALSNARKEADPMMAVRSASDAFRSPFATIRWLS
jgi:hypothetical protein